MNSLLDPPVWSLALGPMGHDVGPRSQIMVALLGALRELAEPGADLPSMQPLEDLAELLAPTWDCSASGRLVLDADVLPREDLGLVTRFLMRAPDWELWLTGRDDTCTATRQILSLSQACWIPWPMDVEQLLALLGNPPLAGRTSPSNPVDATAGRTIQSVGRRPEPERGEFEGTDSRTVIEPELAVPIQPVTSPGTHAAAEDAPQIQASQEQHPVPTTPSRKATESQEPTTNLESDLDAIEAILAGEILPDLPDSAGPSEGDSDSMDLQDRDFPDPASIDLTPEELEAFLESAPTDSGALETHDSPSTEVQPPPSWYRSQIADLADIAQRLDLALAALREQHSQGDGSSDLADSVERLGHDAMRLVQFSRTLGYLASPPSMGTQSVRLDTLLEEMLTGLASQDSHSARLMFQSSKELTVRSDKTLLMQVLDALLNLAALAAGEGGKVRASAAENDKGQAELRIRFPMGPLADVPGHQVLAPYGLQGRLPGMGPNALAAAARIISGQGGSLHYSSSPAPDSEDQALFVLTLPLSPGAS